HDLHPLSPIARLLIADDDSSSSASPLGSLSLSPLIPEAQPRHSAVSRRRFLMLTELDLSPPLQLVNLTVVLTDDGKTSPRI
ncbi:hypothetical protein Dimus_018621, partial [Dionaea muscipula]